MISELDALIGAFGLVTLSKCAANASTPEDPFGLGQLPSEEEIATLVGALPQEHLNALGAGMFGTAVAGGGVGGAAVGAPAGAVIGGGLGGMLGSGISRGVFNPWISGAADEGERKRRSQIAAIGGGIPGALLGIAGGGILGGGAGAALGGVTAGTAFQPVLNDPVEAISGFSKAMQPQPAFSAPPGPNPPASPQ